MKNQKGVSLIALIITIIVIIILAAIVMNSSTDTVGNAQYARFAQEFGEYSDQVALKAADIKADTGIKGQIINNAQNFFMTANGLTTLTSGDGAEGMTVPVGYVLPTEIQTILGINAQTPAYVIKDDEIPNYERYTEGRDFYGDSNGVEYHFITSDGQVFTLPGYPVEREDGGVEYHIDTKDGHYYVVKGNSTEISVGTPVDGDKPVVASPILATSFKANTYGMTSAGVSGDSMDNKGQEIK